MCQPPLPWAAAAAVEAPEVAVVEVAESVAVALEVAALVAGEQVVSGAGGLASREGSG